MSEQTRRYIGLMSGTSIDGIDAAILEISDNGFQLSHTLNYDLPSNLQHELAALCTPGDNEIERMGQADHRLGLAFADAVNTLLNQSKLSANDITAIGSHGQTIRHMPDIKAPFTLQIADPNIIAHQTGITTIADFRRKDMAAGGQAAPLAPAFHQAAFASDKANRVIVNIGGISNITSIVNGKVLLGFDTGPGNGLMDYWAQKNLNKPYDDKGEWGESGTVIEVLLNALLAEPYLKLNAPKSTGRELFNRDWLERHLENTSYAPENVQATLQQYTAQTIAEAILNLDKNFSEIFVCGGGAYNPALMKRIAKCLPKAEVKTTDALNIPPEWVEAAAFAWLAHQTLENLPGNLPQVTGAKEAVILGAIYPA